MERMLSQSVSGKDTETERGIAPFAGDVHREKGKGGQYYYIKSIPQGIGALGTINMELQKPVNEQTILDTIEKSEQAITYNSETGEFVKGNLQYFLRKDYYEVGAEVKPYDNILLQARGEKLNLNLWIPNTNLIFTAPILSLEPFHVDRVLFYGKNRDTGTMEELVLPYDPKVLQDIRISLNNN